MHSKTSEFPLNKLFPNIVTIIGLTFGVTSIRYALAERWEIAVSLLVISAFIDGMDGRLARMLNASSKFGAELDSLTDLENFGVAPALLLYLWALDNISIKGLGWGIALLYIICCAIRLARFNSLGTKPEKDKMYDNLFLGIPAPAGAGLTLIPIMLVFQYDIHFFYNHPLYLGVYLISIAILMASRIPTFSVKNVKIKSDLMYPLLLLIVCFIIALIIEPWLTLPLMGAIYISSIPCSLIYYYSLKK